VSLLFVSGAVAANAQIARGSVLRVNIPSSFTVRDKVLPAGEYTIEELSVGSNVMMLRGEGRSVFFNTIAQNVKGSDESSLVFLSTGDAKYLTQINIAGSSIALNVAQSKAQRAAIAKNATVREAVAATTGF
jgi:hypothetical protein